MGGPERVGYVECGVGEAMQVSAAEVEPGDIVSSNKTSLI